MPSVGHGMALSLLAKSPWQRTKNGFLSGSSLLSVGPFAFYWCCCQGCLLVLQLPRHPPDAPARMKGKKNWFLFPTWECPHCSDLEQTISLSCQSSIHSQNFALSTVLMHFPRIFFLCFFFVASHLGWPCALTLSKPSKSSSPTRIIMGTKRAAVLALGRLTGTREDQWLGENQGYLVHLSSSENLLDLCKQRETGPNIKVLWPLTGPIFASFLHLCIRLK